MGFFGAIWAAVVRVYVSSGTHYDFDTIRYVKEYTSYNLLEKLSGEAPGGMSFAPQFVVLGLSCMALAYAFWPER